MIANKPNAYWCTHGARRDKSNGIRQRWYGDSWFINILRPGTVAAKATLVVSFTPLKLPITSTFVPSIPLNSYVFSAWFRLYLNNVVVKTTLLVFTLIILAYTVSISPYSQWSGFGDNCPINLLMLTPYPLVSADTIRFTQRFLRGKKIAVTQGFYTAIIWL